MEPKITVKKGEYGCGKRDQEGSKKQWQDPRDHASYRLRMRLRRVRNVLTPARAGAPGFNGSTPRQRAVAWPGMDPLTPVHLPRCDPCPRRFGTYDVAGLVAFPSLAGKAFARVMPCFCTTRYAFLQAGIQFIA